eukprot:g45311.t1
MLPGVVVEADTIGPFKGLLDKHMKKGLGPKRQPSCPSDAARSAVFTSSTPCILIWRHVWHNISPDIDPNELVVLLIHVNGD